MTDFRLAIHTEAYDKLDQFALLARQDYNIGDNADWFGTFRGGLYGFYARLHGIVVHYWEVHAWLPRPRSPSETEYHLASLMFNMDSALECLTFALNALGFAQAPSAFRDVGDPSALKRISPSDILGNSVTTPPREPLSGYSQVFPQVQSLWQSHRTMMNLIVEQHDVSKHRQTIFVGGMARLDPPGGFYEALGIPDNPSLRARFWPMAEIILKKDPKLPSASRTPQTVEEQVLLETLVPEFANFVSECGALAFADARANMPLKVATFQRPS
jgi:hypothetical protein